MKRAFSACFVAVFGTAAASIACGACGETPQPRPPDPPPRVELSDFDASAWLSSPRDPAAAASAQRFEITFALECPHDIDVKDLMKRHASAYGSEDAVLAELPRTISGEIEDNGQRGATTRWLDRTRHRSDVLLESADPFRTYGLFIASGVDARGAWEIDLSGGMLRLEKDEGSSENFDAWLLRRGYLHDMSGAGVTATCRVADGKARVWLAFPGQKNVATPSLAFDPTSAELVEMEHTVPDGRRVHGSIEEWGAADEHGVRWPVRMSPHDAIGTTVRFTRNEAGLSCAGGGDCLAAAPPPIAITWPKSGRVTLPMSFEENEIIFSVKVGGHDTKAIVDSGAQATMLDSTAPLARFYTPSVDLRGRGSTQRIPFQMAEIDHIAIGDLDLSHVPTGFVPIPVLGAAGAKRPEIILGLPLFWAGLVRLDYAKSTVTFSRDAAGLIPRTARSVPFDVEAAKLVAEAKVNGSTGRFQLDTGSGNGFGLTQDWANAHGLPGNARFVDPVAQTGAGSSATRSILFRAQTASFGPITFDDHITVIDSPPEPGEVAGLLGNALLARCDAVTFDVAKRTLWLEGTCTRETPENKTGWHLVRSDDAHFADRPWVVGNVLSGSSAEAATVRVGDRLLEVDGKPATLEREQFEPALHRAVGTKVVVTLQRGPEKIRVVLVLEKLLSNDVVRK